MSALIGILIGGSARDSILLRRGELDLHNPRVPLSILYVVFIRLLYLLILIDL